MKKTLLGTVLCVAALLLLSRNQAIFGLPLFIVGIVLMYGGKWPRR